MSRFPVDPNIAIAKTISTEVYNSAGILEEAREKIFAPSWQYIGDTDRVPAAGSIFPFTLLEGYLNEPLMLTRDREEQVRCLSNVCTHRGNLLAYEACHSSQLRCKYHGRVFGLDGKFQFMPEFKAVENFPTAADDLKQLPIFQWGKLVFTTLESRFTPELFFEEMMARVAWFPMDKLVHRPDLSSTYKVAANWALYC